MILPRWRSRRGGAVVCDGGQGRRSRTAYVANNDRGKSVKYATLAVVAVCVVLLSACESVPKATASTVPGPQVIAAAADSRAAKVTFSFTGRIIAVSDGDTLVVADQSDSTTIRMSDMDAPEVSHGASRPGQRFGRAAEASLKSMASVGSDARAECYERDQYQRAVCTVFVAFRNLNLEQIERGWGMLPDNPGWMRDPRSDPAQAQAKQQRRGVWQDPDPQSPASWRHLCWEKHRCAGAEQ
jgi:micrococcal nuclease